MTGPPAVSFPSNNDAFEGPIVVTDGGFPYLENRTATQIYVSVLQFPNTNPENTINTYSGQLIAHKVPSRNKLKTSL